TIQQAARSKASSCTAILSSDVRSARALACAVCTSTEGRNQRRTFREDIGAEGREVRQQKQQGGSLLAEHRA
ncbi:hypothetical protein, partial [Salmonella enterica]|uniref:hypothetical protein n=1 Tax=Salmonella enterica TaxID=28901 RepID=UPI00373FD7A1